MDPSDQYREELAAEYGRDDEGRLQFKSECHRQGWVHRYLHGQKSRHDCQNDPDQTSDCTCGWSPSFKLLSEEKNVPQEKIVEPLSDDAWALIESIFQFRTNRGRTPQREVVDAWVRWAVGEISWGKLGKIAEVARGRFLRQDPAKFQMLLDVVSDPNGGLLTEAECKNIQKLCTFALIYARRPSRCGTTLSAAADIARQIGDSR